MIKHAKEINLLVKATQSISKVEDYIFDIESNMQIGKVYNFFIGLRMDATSHTICYGVGDTKIEAFDDLKNRAFETLIKLAAEKCDINPEHVGQHVFV